MKFDGILFEGITGSGKSTLFRRLQRSPALQNYESQLFLSQAYTLRMAAQSQEKKCLHSLVDVIDRLFETCRNSEFAERSDFRGSLLYACEGFHYYMAVDRVEQPLQRDLIRSVEDRMITLGTRVVLLHMDSSAIIENSVRSTLAHRGPGWRAFVAQFGSTSRDIADHFRRRQDRLLELVSECKLPVMRLDSTEQDWEVLSARVIAYLWEPGAGV